MELIIDFYKSLDTLNLIIFWGIIIVIVLLLIFSLILINKNKKLKSIVDRKTKYEEELPIIKEEPIPTSELTIEELPESMPLIEEEIKESIIEPENISKPIETEKQFIAEEHVMEYNKELFSLPNLEKANNLKEEKTINESPKTRTIELPSAPYQRNVLREMSLSQTSPIGINRYENKADKKIEIAKDLEESLHTENIDNDSPKEEQTSVETNNQIKKELTKIEESSPRRTEIKVAPQPKITSNHGVTSLKKEIQDYYGANLNTVVPETQAKDILNSQPKLTQESPRKSSSEKYLEEVSKKLAEAEIPDEIERTNYELKQEEDAIISYKELMEKKDTIQTVDEEEAVISIEELMNRNNQKQELQKEEAKLYNLSEEEENDKFIKELKQFRNDL